MIRGLVEWRVGERMKMGREGHLRWFGNRFGWWKHWR